MMHFQPAWFFPPVGTREEPRTPRLAIVTSQFSPTELNLHVLNHAVHDCQGRNMDPISAVIGVKPVKYAREVHPSLPFCVLATWKDVQAGIIPDPWDTPEARAKAAQAEQARRAEPVAAR